MGKRAGSRKSLKRPKVYDALRKKGYSKTKAAKISNAQAHKGKGIGKSEKKHKK